MKEKIDQYLQEIDCVETSSAEEIEQFRIRYLGRKGLLNDLFEEFKTVPNENKKFIGQELNRLKNAVQEKILMLQKSSLPIEQGEKKVEDLTLPAGQVPPGTLHPISIVRREILDIFSRIGFTVADGPEIEDDWHVFSGLNFPPDHPARDMQDTFFIEKDPDLVLRTHTSSVQVRVMESQRPPLRIVMPGRVYRNEAVSARAHCQFHQIEGLYIDDGVSFADMKQTLLYFAQEFFGKTRIRLRPSYFPFTEPSAEMDVFWGLNSEADHRITKGTGWLEIMGCGMVDPNVLSASNINPDKYSGFAFGMGIERIAMLRYQIDDLRMYFENDVRFLKQFNRFI
ncbi:MAG: phenylalanine--tRNA ligase subunit alpha [Crocinitomicaceae bacterium]|nr:phenylalanine--tRNA ligase subunit alpha [Crocinitomicaceae bacterium]